MVRVVIRLTTNMYLVLPKNGYITAQDPTLLEAEMKVQD